MVSEMETRACVGSQRNRRERQEERSGKGRKPVPVCAAGLGVWGETSEQLCRMRWGPKRQKGETSTGFISCLLRVATRGVDLHFGLHVSPTDGASDQISHSAQRRSPGGELRPLVAEIRTPASSYSKTLGWAAITSSSKSGSTPMGTLRALSLVHLCVSLMIFAQWLVPRKCLKHISSTELNWDSQKLGKCWVCSHRL